MSRERDRLYWVDAARAIGIVLVVFGHVWRGLRQAELFTDAGLFAAVDAAIYLFHMPLFFLLSGLFFEKVVRRDGARLSILKRCETLLYPLLIWSWITAAVLLLANSVTTRDTLTLTEALLFPFPPRDIFWFLWALFLIQAFCVFLVRASTAILAGFFLLSFAAATFMPFVPGPDLLRGATANLPFFLFGILLDRFDLQRLRPTVLTGIVGAGVLAISLGGAAFFGLYAPPLGTLLSLIAAASFCAAVYGFAPLVPAKSMAILTYVGATSMAIYVMHVIPSAAVRIALAGFGVDAVWLHLLVGTLAGLLLPLLAYEVLKRLGLLRLFGLGRDRARPVTALSPS